MKVQQLFLRNVRNLKDLDLDFRDPVTDKPLSRIVLAGANGSGKTTILESLFGLLNTVGKLASTTGKATTFRQLEDANIALEADSQLQILFELELPGASTPVWLSAVHGSKGPVEGITHESMTTLMLGGKSLPGQRAWTGSSLPNMIRKLAQSIQDAQEHENEAAGSVLYFPSNRLLPSFQRGELGVEPRLYQWAYRYQANSQWKGSTESYLFSLNYLDLEDRDQQIPANRFGQAVELVNSILDGKQIARIHKGRVVVETTTGETHGLADLSSGEKQLALLLIEIVRRIVPGSILLIDEPEISLHEAWQRGLMAALDKIIEQYDAQVILATHSVEIATWVMPEEVISLNNLGLPLGQWEPEKEALP